MRILWLRPDKPDDISVGRQRIAALLRERGHEVYVCNTKLIDFVRVFQDGYDAIIGTTRLGGMIGAWRRVGNGPPLIVDHIDPISQFGRNHSRVAVWVIKQLEHITFRIADYVMVVYEEEVPRVSQYARRVGHTSLGVDYNRFAKPSQESIETARSILSGRVRTDSHRLIYVGGLEPAYNLSIVVDAMEHLPGWDFVIFGDGSLRPEIEKAASHRPDIHYFGTVSHEVVPGLLYVCDVGISLVDDRNTLKLLEYGAAKLPAVSVDGDPRRRFDGLIEFCTLDPEDVARAVRRARCSDALNQFQEAVQDYRWDDIANQYERALMDIVSDVS